MLHTHHQKKRRFILYNSVELVTENVDVKMDIINKTDRVNVKQVLSKLNTIYKNIISS